MAKFTTLEEFKTLATGIVANVGTQTIVVANMADITEGVADLSAQLITANATTAQLTIDNDELIKQNGKLFLRLGSNLIPDNKPLNATKETEVTIIDMASLVDAKGRIIK